MVLNSRAFNDERGKDCTYEFSGVKGKSPLAIVLRLVMARRVIRGAAKV